MEDTVGCSASRAAREKLAAEIIFGSAELGRFDVSQKHWF